MNHYIHSVPGRLRVKIPSIVDRPKKSPAIEQLFADQEGIDRVTVNTVTGSVVVHYDTEETGVEAILNRLRDHRLLDDAGLQAAPKPIRRMSDRVGQRVGKALIGYAVGRALEANGIGFLAALI